MCILFLFSGNTEHAEFWHTCTLYNMCDLISRILLYNRIGFQQHLTINICDTCIVQQRKSTCLPGHFEKPDPGWGNTNNFLIVAQGMYYIYIVPQISSAE
jgi:hypothetical protein